MREILFKAKRKDNGEWVKGFLFKLFYDEMWCIGNKSLQPNDYSEIIGENKDWFYINPDTICQYTGLKDKNGKEIYEGDIVEVTEEDEYLHLEWDKDTASFVMSGRHFEVDFDTYLSYEIEVVGNIFDNPELLNNTDKQAGEYVDNEVLKPAT